MFLNFFPCFFVFFVCCFVLFLGVVVQDAMQEERRAFKPSTKRDTPIEENLRLFDLLLKGDKGTEAFCLRAKADYASVNGKLVYGTSHKISPGTWYLLL